MKKIPQTTNINQKISKNRATIKGGKFRSNNFNSAISSFELELAQSNIPWRLISVPKISPSPIKPSFRRNALLGIILSAIVGIIVALIRDKMDYVFHSSKM